MRTSLQLVQVRDSHAQRRRSATLMGARATLLVDGKLVTQREDLELQGGSRSEAGAERGGEGEEDTAHRLRGKCRRGSDLHLRLQERQVPSRRQ